MSAPPVRRAPAVNARRALLAAFAPLPGRCQLGTKQQALQSNQGTARDRCPALPSLAPLAYGLSLTQWRVRLNRASPTEIRILPGCAPGSNAPDCARDIVLLQGDESEALTYPCLACVWATSGA